MFWNKIYTVALLMIATSIAFCPLCAHSSQLLGLTTDLALVDIDPATGAATNHRTINNFDESGVLIDIEFGSDGTLYALSTIGTYPNEVSLFTIDPITADAVRIARTGLTDVAEGDLAFHPQSGKLYATYQVTSAGQTLFTVDVDTATPTTIGALDTPDPSGLAFDEFGMLYMLDPWANGAAGTISRVDPADFSVIAQAPLSMSLGGAVGMDFDSQTNRLYVADSRMGLYTLDAMTGQLTTVGNTGVSLAGLAFAVPEPFWSNMTTVLLVFWATRARRRIRAT